jgi:hypothetical protein
MQGDKIPSSRRTDEHMSANERVLLASLVEERRVRVAPELSSEDFFGLFVSEQILWDHSLSWEEIQDGVVDGGDDGGIDSIFAFLNDKLLVDETMGGAFEIAHTSQSIYFRRRLAWDSPRLP